ncbi:MAG: leucine-rich repeat protein [Lachnospiraceae bacterium]|jgi:hypothetical protein|nr:leucine-rich repeat protein [Lachnospiraceae bacterium]
MEQVFAYERTGTGIRILRCYGTGSQVSVPRELEGLPVTELAAYAFAEKMDGEPGNNSGLPCICGASLVGLSLPDTIQRLGRYLFYNCTSLSALSFYSNIAFLGAGMFTGCGHLSRLILRQKEGQSCLREILQDLRQPVMVDCYFGREKEPAYRLVYPEFFEEAVENTPARIISTQTHGMGIQYRNTFQDTQVVFQEYDRLFKTGKYNMDMANIIEMSAARLRYPYALEEDARAGYQAWLKGHLKEAAAYFQEQEKTEEIKWLAEGFAKTREELEVLVQIANSHGDTALVSHLLHVLHMRFPRGRKTFAL